MITTYTMIAYSGKRSEESQKVMDLISSREWGLLLLDEVHVVPANMFRKARTPLARLCPQNQPASCWLTSQKSVNDKKAMITPSRVSART